MRTWLDLCRLRAAPQQLPASTALLALALVNYCLVGIAVALPGSGWSMALLLTLLDLAVMAGLTTLVLWVTGKPARLNQTLSALAGTGALLGLLALPLVLTAPEPVPAWAGLSWLVLLFWSLAVRGHILRHALEITFGMGLLVSAGYALVLIWLVRWWLPAPVAG
jgi:formate-dependent nitrite reductase membrane component NrfD